MSGSFDLRHLRYFVAVAEELNFRRAAERLFISQPPLSRQIRELEQIVGAKLLERDTTRVQLTAAGKIALARAQKLLTDADDLVLAVKQASAAARRPLRIAASIVIPVSKQTQLRNAWLAALGADALEVEFGESKKLQPRVRQRQFDFALLGGPGDFRGLESEEVQNFPLVVTVSASHAAAGKREVRLIDMQGTPLFWFPRSYNPAYYDHCARIFKESGFAPEYIHVPPGQLSTLERIRSGEGFSLLTTAQVEMKVDGVVHRPLKEGARLGVSLHAMWHADAWTAERAAQLRELVAASRQVLAHKRGARTAASRRTARLGTNAAS
jgi:DNA-binding transcriptional LysR family regulator